MRLNDDGTPYSKVVANFAFLLSERNWLKAPRLKIKFLLNSKVQSESKGLIKINIKERIVAIWN